MAKRFVDTNKYKKPFLRGLPGPYKLLWDFLCVDCDHAGIWIVDFEIAQMYVGVDMPVNKSDALKYFNNEEQRIVEIDGGKKWFVPSFIEFQYGFLSEKNRAHASVISILKKQNLLNPDLSLKTNKPLTSPLQGVKDKDMDMELDKDITAGEDFQPTGIIPEMCALFSSKNEFYPIDREVDYPSLRLIAEKILKWDGGSGSITKPENHDTISRRWGELVDFIRSDQHYSGYSLTRINKHFQSIAQSFNTQTNPNGTFKQSSPVRGGKPGTSEARIETARKW